jgi:hypothetical protein
VVGEKLVDIVAKELIVIKTFKTRPMKTAVEWLIDELYKQGISLYTPELIEQAKEMEKEQKIKFAENCLDKALDLDIRTAFSNVEKYYNETFKQQEQ